MEEPKSLDSLFKEKMFRIPDYQRRYAWQREQLKDFWEDLINLHYERAHYTGVITLKQIPTREVAITDKEYWLVEDHSYKLYHVVDGQQHLTTFIIFLQAFVDFYKAMPENAGKTDADIYVTDSLSVVALQEKFLYKSKPTGDRFRTYKFGYTADNPSYSYLKHRILGEAGGGALQETFYTLNLSKAKDYFSNRLHELLEQGGISALQDIYKKLTKKFLFNEYIIKDEFDVFVAFETMNNRGKKLSDLELLKNRLIYLSTLYDDDELEPDDRKSLRDTINDAWKEVYHQLGKNKLKPLNDDDFLRAHWIMYFKYTRKGGENYIRFLLEEQFTPRRVLIKSGPEDPVLADDDVLDVDGEEGEEFLAELEAESEAFASVNPTSDRLHPTDIRDFVNSLKDSAKHWFDSHYPIPTDGMNVEEQRWIERLNRIGITYFRPLVMSILKNESDSAERIKIFKRIERFIFIAFRMNGTKSNYRNTEFYNFARLFDSGEATSQQIRTILDLRLSWTFNDDKTLNNEEFFFALKRKFDSGEGYYGWTGLRYFLYEYELSLLNASRQVKIDWSDLQRFEKDKVSIEHIYPQTSTTEWAAPFLAVKKGLRRNYNSSLGNLLLLSMSINSSLQNDSFANKKHPKFNAAKQKIRNGYSDGSHSEIEVARSVTWGPDEIRERGIRMLRFMEKRWDFKFENDNEREVLLFLE